MTTTLYNEYRPDDWDSVMGQDAVINSIAPLIEAGSTHCFLLVGASGLGKTTIARIAAAKLGAKPHEIQEVNAAKFSGKDDMEEVTSNLHFVPLGGGRLVKIIDESQQLSKAAWNLLLKEIEEPPDWVYWFFCTTEVGKIPEAVLTRSVRYTLQPLPWENLLALVIQPIAGVEDIQCGADILGMIARAADGSPRQALVFLEACRNTTDINEARALCQQVSEEENSGAFNLAKQLMAGGKDWNIFRVLLEPLKDQNPEGVRRVIAKYATTAILNAKNDQQARKAAAILDMFGVPYNSNEGITPLVTGVARLVLM